MAPILICYICGNALQFKPDLILNTIFSDTGVFMNWRSAATRWFCRVLMSGRACVELSGSKFLALWHRWRTLLESRDLRMFFISACIFSKYWSTSMRTVFASRLAPVVGGASIAVNPWVKEEKIFKSLWRSRMHKARTSLRYLCFVTGATSSRNLKNWKTLSWYPILSCWRSSTSVVVGSTIFRNLSEAGNVADKYALQLHWNAHGHAVVLTRCMTWSQRLVPR